MCESLAIFAESEKGREAETLVTHVGHSTEGTLDFQGDRDCTRSSDCSGGVKWNRLAHGIPGR